MDKNKKENEALFTLVEDLSDDAKRFKNSLAETKNAICKRVKKITELQDEISQQEKELFEYMAKKERVISILTTALSERDY